MCAYISYEESENLQKAKVEHWLKALYASSNQIYGLCLENIDEVRFLLPSFSRCAGKLKDQHFR
jgi:hypothetical protein